MSVYLVGVDVLDFAAAPGCVVAGGTVAVAAGSLTSKLKTFSSPGELVSARGALRKHPVKTIADG
ncbi:MAG: hypothetical protein ABR606_07940 [Vicinamibacterales bacterium]